MMKNKLTDLNDHMFAQLERLNDEDLSDEELAVEMERSRAISGISKTIIENAKLALDAEKYKTEYRGYNRGSMPAMLKLGD